MEYLTRSASNCYLETTKVHFHFGSLSWTHYLDRMLALHGMTEPGDANHSYASKILLIEEWNQEDEWPFEQPPSIELEGKETLVSGLKPGLSLDRKGYYQFLSRVSGLKDWVFHQYDDDYFPSIPHGHLNGRKQPKLDPYLGWVYRGSKQTERKSKKLLIELWNDDEFRRFASIAIDYYLCEHPYYTGWRVKNPRRLPRKR